jgi:hypothetical protein
VSGKRVESSAIAKAPNNAMMPPPTHAIIKVNPSGTGAAAYPANKKIPDPIILPVTMDVASNVFKTRLELLIVLGMVL